MSNNQKEPIKHHYVPRAFLKAWANEDNRVNWENIEKNINNKNKIDSIFYEKNLYKLATSLESDFITPFIDNKLFPSFKKLRENNWHSLSNKDKTNIIKYIITLSARNPKSIQAMQKAPISEEYSHMLNTGFSDFIHLNENQRKEIIDGFASGNLFFMGIMIDELELSDIEINSVKNQTHKEVFLLFKNLITLSKKLQTYTSSYSSIILKNINNIVVREFCIESPKLITSNYPVIINGISPNKIDEVSFFIMMNISPQKGILFTLNREIISEFDKLLNNEDLLSTSLNEVIRKYSTQIVSKIEEKK